ncbi:hypothetical protein ANCCAN_20815 [Ancylostoma caninum]|uniref:Uncharacterized protein n=1 Tax=Ancylostoma caninum TaxID=29170 RepID=A0A368FPA2_ANCCA|nr:hypothetical protein ANCCAN_20815 [Ancylostoma caninum]
MVPWLLLVCASSFPSLIWKGVILMTPILLLAPSQSVLRSMFAYAATTSSDRGRHLNFDTDSYHDIRALQNLERIHVDVHLVQSR